MDVTISNFLAKSFHVNPKPNVNKFTRWYVNAVKPTRWASGSVSELYIGTLMPCVGDVDFISTRETNIAVPGCSEVRQWSLNLPEYLDDDVEVDEIIDSEYPSYVYLVDIGKLTRGSRDNGSCRFEPSFYGIEGLPFVGSDLRGSDPLRHGPSQRHPDLFPTIDGRPLTVDDVQSIRYLSWPQQANDWPTRERHYGWPTQDTIDDVVWNGCDLVQVAHHQHRRLENSERYKPMWRLSFSRAETVLLNSMTPLQQLIYHMLRIIVGIEELNKMTDSDGCSVLSRYHVKTLLMWQCERKATSWWTSHSVLRLCSDILISLIDCFKRSSCCGYFVTNANLFECDMASSCVEQIVSRLEYLTDLRHLAEWFVDNYVKQCAEWCPPEVQLLFENSGAIEELSFALSGLVEWYHETDGTQRLLSYKRARADIHRLVSYLANDSDFSTLKAVKKDLDQVDPYLPRYFDAAVSLLTSNRIISMFDLSVCEANALIALARVETSTNICCSADVSVLLNSSSPLSLCQTGLHLLQSAVAAGKNTASTPYKIQLLLSYSCLQKAKAYANSDCNLLLLQLQNTVNAYLSVLFYVTGQYRKAMNLCNLILKSKAINNFDEHQKIEGRLLPKVSNDIDNVLGLVTLYCHVLSMQTSQTTMLTSTYNHGTFCLAIFVYYLQSKMTSKLSCLEQYQKRCIKYTEETTLNISDVLLLHCIARAKSDIKNSNDVKPHSVLSDVVSLQFNVANLQSLLLLQAVERLTCFREEISREFVDVCKVATSDVTAIHAYKCGDYERCLELCFENLSMLWQETVLFDVLLSHLMTPLLDDSLASMIGVVVIVGSDYEVDYCAWTNQLTLSLYMAARCEYNLKRSRAEMIGSLQALRTMHRKHSDKHVVERLLLTSLYRLIMTSLTNPKENVC